MWNHLGIYCWQQPRRAAVVCGATLVLVALALVVEDRGGHGDGDGYEDVDECGSSDDG